MTSNRALRLASRFGIVAISLMGPRGQNADNWLLTPAGPVRQAQADARTDGKPDVLRVKECTVELAIEWSVKGDAELDVWVVKLGGDVTKTNRDTITVRLEAIDSQMIAALR